jgi:hypothetical protein
MNANFSITPAAAKFLKMTVEQAMSDERRTSILAGNTLRMLGYQRKYNHAAWDRGMRWFSPSGEIHNATNVTVLIYAAAK